MKFLNRTDVSRILADAPEIVRPVVIDTYSSLAAGHATSAKTTFLKIPNEATSRFVSLPAHAGVEGGAGAAGTKWVSNFRGNVERDIPPLNTLLLLSDTGSGAPLACLEGSELNLRRTAASAFLAAERFGFDPSDGPIGLVGAGALAKAFCAELIQTYSGVHSVVVSDIVADRAHELVASLLERGVKASVGSTEEILRDANIVVLGTSAEEPWIDLELLPTEGKIILNISADDLPAEYFSRVLNVTDRVSDVASMPVSLGRAIAQGLETTDILELPHLLGTDVVTTERTVVFSPFGLSVLDVALAEKIYRIADSQDVGMAWDHRG
ncbi:NAD(P)-binding domain-containing protein [Specibacter sp. RAF43]|uniref:NAD(P)-binding domain-containing protein n=1 Tax=Specibacter sp. RAF43 TaxID=3233057 RepID=UPI003F9831A5